MSVGNLAEAVKEIRRMHSLTQQELSEQLGHSQTWCSRVESGSREPSIRDLRLLSFDYGLQLDSRRLDGKGAQESQNRRGSPCQVGITTGCEPSFADPRDGTPQET